MMLLCPGVSKAQATLESEITIDRINIDSLYYIGEWVLEESIIVSSDLIAIPTQNWLYDPIRGNLTFRETDSFSFQGISEVSVSFKYYPYSLRRFYNDKAVQPLDSSIFDDESSNQFSVFSSSDQTKRSNGSELQQRGSLSRGIIVGTNQDFALESGLDFELSGKLTDDVTISAVLTDKSIPIQPDGTTQNLKEFDKVFIQVQAPNTTIEMGDVDISMEKSTFAKLNRRLQGAAGYNTSNYTNLSAAASVVRGVFKSVNFQGLEGVQGPYRLTGNENEEFVIILAGTERVYINGQLVQRGEDGDYIIDYGLGEIYFTNNLLIKDETRIVVEYEYIDQNFNRTLVAAQGEGSLVNDRFTIGATVIRQADGNNLLSQQTLTESDIDILRQAGDDRNAARVSGAERIDPEEENVNVLYAQVDTVVNGQTYTIFKNIPGSENAVFRVRFSNVGEFQGSYRRAGTSVNGLLFEWVGPNRGDYEPFRNLPAPIEQQMAAINTTFSLSDNIRLFGEWAVSDYDQNRFSALDDQDNVDHSYLGGVQIDSLKTGTGVFSLKAERRFSGSNFEFFERTRDVEFDRKWNLSSFEKSQETINEMAARYDFNSNSSINGEYGLIERFGFSAQRQASAFETENENGFRLKYRQDWIQSEDDLQMNDGTWFRQQARISNQFTRKRSEHSFIPYMSFEHETRVQRDQQSDSLTNQSLRFYEVAPGVRYEANKWLLDYSVAYRNSFRVFENRLSDEAASVQQSLQIDLFPSNFFTTQNKIAIRNKEYTSDFREQGNTNKNSLLIRSNTSYSSISENWDGNLLYEVNTQQQALLQETFIEVGPEIGQYVWDDLNDDGVEQLDEFFLELTPNEGTYIRQLLPSDELFPVIDLRVRLRNEIKPFGYLRAEGNLNRFLNQITLRSRFDIAENSTTSEIRDIYFLNISTFRDSATTIQGRFALEKELDLFPEFNKYDLSIRYNQLRSLVRRSSELQTIYQDAFAVDMGYEITSTIEGESKIVSATNRTTSNSISNRNFNIISKTYEQSFGATVNRSWRTGIIISYSEKEDIIIESNKVEVQIVKIRNTNRFFLWRKVQANSSFEIRNVSINGSTNAVGNFELTEGSGSGTHAIWSLSSSYRVSNLIRLNFMYDGRTVKDRTAIHTAKLTLKATF
ncbi:MAG TPA: hypothetical protein DEO59_10780 [Balneola sp.]|nr:hypothetical protein [Balneola sp.]MAO79025.1 hypothetical protein [Balneola sp.]MBF63684.1 hypothetical protein [Balneola sp.]HBZ38923.1 hypothetical protein [Balneola sp.]|tara:strand:+ start:29149 stop:32604 length:3456 start_codon:yes stop_codon:yes gene_type:complete